MGRKHDQMLMVVCLSEKVVDSFVLFCFKYFYSSLYFISSMYFFDIQEKQDD